MVSSLIETIKVGRKRLSRVVEEEGGVVERNCRLRKEGGEGNVGDEAELEEAGCQPRQVQ